MLSLKRLFIMAGIGLLVAGVFFTVHGTAQAHGGVEVGDYELNIGFLNEPAYVGEPNGLELRVVRNVAEEGEEHAEEEEHAEAEAEPTEAAEDHAEGEEEHQEAEDHAQTQVPVSGLEETLRVEIIHGSARRELELRPMFGEEGAYTADVLPVAEGDYTWRIWGEIEGTPVEVELTSAPDTFSSIRSKDEVAFPAPELTTTEVAGQVQTALYVGIAGVVLGLVGTALGIMGLRRKA